MLWTLVAMSLALAVKSRQLARRFLLCLPISVGVMMSVMLGAVAHDARYVAGPLLIAQYFVGLVLLDWIWHRDESADGNQREERPDGCNKAK